MFTLINHDDMLFCISGQKLTSLTVTFYPSKLCLNALLSMRGILVTSNAGPAVLSTECDFHVDVTALYVVYHLVNRAKGSVFCH